MCLIQTVLFVLRHIFLESRPWICPVLLITLAVKLYLGLSSLFCVSWTNIGKWIYHHLLFASLETSERSISSCHFLHGPWQAALIRLNSVHVIFLYLIVCFFHVLIFSDSLPHGGGFNGYSTAILLFFHFMGNCVENLYSWLVEEGEAWEQIVLNSVCKNKWFVCFLK